MTNVYSVRYDTTGNFWSLSRKSESEIYCLSQTINVGVTLMGRIDAYLRLNDRTPLRLYHSGKYMYDIVSEQDIIHAILTYD